jgi:hypothetical protein
LSRKKTKGRPSAAEEDAERRDKTDEDGIEAIVSLMCFERSRSRAEAPS